MRWVETKPSCVNCRIIWGNKGEDPPCPTCAIILEDENIDIVKVFFSVRHHVVVHEMSKNKTYVDLDVRAVQAAMDIYGVYGTKNRERVYEKVRALFFEQGGEF